MLSLKSNLKKSYSLCGTPKIGERPKMNIRVPTDEPFTVKKTENFPEEIRTFSGQEGWYPFCLLFGKH